MAVDVDVIEAVADQPVDLVHDAVGDMVGGDVAQHSLQFGSLRRPCGPARVDELGDHVGAEGFGFAALRLALGRDRESLVPPAGGGLLLGGDPLLGHRRYPPSPVVRSFSSKVVIGIFSRHRVGYGFRGLGVEAVGQVQHQRDQSVHVGFAPGHGFGDQPASGVGGACIPYAPQVDTPPPRERLWW